MSKTLKETYNERQLLEARNISLVLEALDAQKVGEIANAIDALERLIPQDKMGTFYAAVDAAKNELSKTLTGGVLTKAKQAITQPVSKAVALADGLKAGFRMLPQLLKTFVPQDKQNVDDTLDNLIPDPAKKQEFIKAFSNAIRPSGIVAALGKLFGGGGVPFLKNVDAAVAEMMQNMKKNDLVNLSRTTAQAPQTISPDVAKELQTQAQGQGETKPGTKPAEQTVQAAAPQATQATQSSQETQPTQPAEGTLGSDQKPDANVAAKRDVAIQRAVRNRNAFNSQVLGSLPNAEVAADMKAIAKILGIKL